MVCCNASVRSLCAASTAALLLVALASTGAHGQAGDAWRAPLDSPAGWQLLEYRGIPPHRVRFSPAGLELRIDRSAMPLVHPLPKPMAVRSVRVRGRIEGTLAIPPGRQGEEKFDDYAFRLGLVESGNRTLNFLQRLTAADWVRRLFELAPKDSGISRILFLNVGIDASRIGKARQHPLSELLYERVVAAPRADNRFDFEHVLDQPATTLAVWLSADGDDSGSVFTVHVEEITLRSAVP